MSNKNKHKCLACRRLTYNWFCQTHYRIKEVGYAIYDAEHLSKFPEKERDSWKQRSFDGLLAFANFVIKDKNYTEFK